jgi:hypothetical protein
MFDWQRQVACGLFGATVLSLATIAHAENLHSGLIGYWPLDEGMGEIAGDAFGAEFDDGFLREEPQWMNSNDAKLGDSALFFEGFQDVLVADSTDLNITSNAVTISAWVNLELLPSEMPEAFGAIFDSNSDSYVMYLDRGNRELRFKVTDSDSTAERPGVPESMLTLSEWHHVMGVYDGDEATAKIYFNGMPIDKHVNGALVDPVLSGQIAGIGGNPTLDPGNPSVYFFNGAIDDVAVWNRALGLGEAAYLYNNGAGNAVGAANPDIAFVPDEPPIEPVAPTVPPVIHYQFEGSLANSGSGGATYDATLLDTPGVNDAVFGTGSQGLGLDLRENPVSQAAGGDAVSVDYTLTDNGTIVFDYQVDEYYNFQSLWTNSVDANDWEMWVFQDGVVRGRVQDSAIASYDLDLLGGLGETYQIGFTWERSDDGSTVNVKLYVDGELRQETLSGPWVDPGNTFFIGGGDGTNHYGTGIWDEFQIYDVALSPGEMLYLFGSPSLVGDFNGDGVLDAADLDVMAAGMVAGDTAYDLDGDGDIDSADRTSWVNDLAKTWMGDANLDGEFNSADFVLVFQAGKYEAGTLALWSEGDWDGDQRFDSGDFVAAFQNGGYENGPRAAELASVPEPSGLMLIVSAIAGLAAWRRRR